MFRGFLGLFVTLRGRLILLVCFATVPALLAIFYVAANERESAMLRMETEARQLGVLASREHSHQLLGAKDLLHRLGSPLACGAVGAAESPCPEYLPALLDSLPQFANIGVLDVRGRLVCSAVGFQPPLNMADNPVFARALSSNEAEVGSYTIGPIVRRPVLHVAYAIRDASQLPCWVAFVALDLGWLDKLAHQAKLPPDYALLITDREARVLAQSGDTAAAPAPGGAPSIAGLDRVLHRTGGLVLDVGKPRTRRFFVATPMGGMNGLFAVVGLPYEQVQSEAARVFYRTMIGLVVLTVFTIAVAILATEVSVLRVVHSLSNTARRFGAGDLSVRTPLPESHGELRDLASSFNVMADALAARHWEAMATQERLRALSHRLQVARDSEAERIARELHDELGQVLTSLTIDLTRLQRVCVTGARDDCNRALRESVDAMIGHIQGAIEFVRRIATELRPAALDRLGIAAAVQGLANEFEAKSGLAVISDVRDAGDPCDNLVATTLYRIAQEALTNVLRHANATEVRIDLVGTEDGLTLCVQDNGIGMDDASSDSKHALGLLGMKERAHLAGGSCKISSAPGVGTTVEVRLPRRAPDAVEDGD
ncbi:histidine kinase [Candidatus Binatia bacterium]|nr:histidine kinase [Candidatus Binatia bacterium]